MQRMDNPHPDELWLKALADRLTAPGVAQLARFVRTALALQQFHQCGRREALLYAARSIEEDVRRGLLLTLSVIVAKPGCDGRTAAKLREVGDAVRPHAAGQ